MLSTSAANRPRASRWLAPLLVAAILILACAPLPLLPSLAPSEQPTPEGESIIGVSTDDPEMNAAIRRAQETLTLFLDQFRPAGAGRFYQIKAAFPYGADSVEQMWIGLTAVTDQGFDGILLNEPYMVSALHYGGQVSVAFGSVSDWLIIEGDRLLGGFTIYVLRERMSPADRAGLDAEYGRLMGAEPLLP